MSESGHETPSENPRPNGPPVSSGDAVKTGYQVGYKRPPIYTRFQPGQSGNPRGRPAGRPNHNTTVERVMNEKVPVRQGENTRHMTKFEAMLQAQTAKGMKGDARSAGMVINLMYRIGSFGDQQHERTIEITPAPQKERPAAKYFIGIDAKTTTLTVDEKIELSRLAEEIDLGGDATALSVAAFVRFKELIEKGRGKSVTLQQ
jgi:hypothetical protein